MEEQDVSVRFKYGIHTIYMFVDLTEPMSKVKTDLLELLRERYPSGLTTSFESAQKLKIPESDSSTYLALGALAVPNSAEAGWKKIKFDEDQTALKTGLKQNSIVAFTFLESADDEAEFLVEWPKEVEEDEEAGTD